MKRTEKIKLINGILKGHITFEEFNPPDVEVWMQDIGTEYFEHFKTGERLRDIELDKRSIVYTNKSIIQILFVEGKTIL